MTDIHHVTSDNGDGVRHISNSEVGTWLTCRRKYHYNFGLNLEPRKMGSALSRGIIGHDVLAAYYEALQSGETYEDARAFAVKTLGTIMSKNPDTDLDLIMHVRSILDAYWDYTVGDPQWEILAVEKQFDLPLSEEFTMPMRLDLLVNDRTTGKTVLVDHKFFYDFPNQDKLALNVQFPKYLGALRFNGIYVDQCMLNVLRTRKLKAPMHTDLFQRFIFAPSNAKIRNAIRNHISACQEIVEYRDLPVEAQPFKALPVLNDYICKGCQFTNICQTEFDGGDPSYLIDTEFRPNSYGYNEEA